MPDVTLDDDLPRQPFRMVMESGEEYRPTGRSSSSQVVAEPPRTRPDPGPHRVGSALPPPPRPAADEGVAVAFQVDGHTFRTVVNEVVESTDGRYLVFDVTGRRDVFLPFAGLTPDGDHRSVRPVIALPQGNTLAYCLAVTDHPPLAVKVAGRAVYAVPIVSTAQAPPTVVSLFENDVFAPASYTPTPVKEPESHGEARSDRPGDDPAGPDATDQPAAAAEDEGSGVTSPLLV